jgi:hypothetical protein
VVVIRRLIVFVGISSLSMVVMKPKPRGLITTISRLERFGWLEPTLITTIKRLERVRLGCPS